MLKHLSISLGAAALAVLLGAGVCTASPVTIKYRLFPSGKALLPKLTVGSPVKTTAAKDLYGPASAEYGFIFWNKNGALQAGRKVDVTSGDATAWYYPIGGGPCPTGQTCNVVQTWKFSLPADKVVSGTPIGSVTPPGLWTSPETSFSTTTSAASSITVTAANGTAHHLAGFVDWLQLFATTAKPGLSFSVPAGGSAYAIGFYGSTLSIPPPCIPDPEHTCPKPI